MSAIPAFLKQIPADARNFVPISSLAYPGGINSLNATNGQLATAAWSGTGRPAGPAGYTVTAGLADGTRYTSSINGPGAGKLRDMGKTYVSASRVFRKVQLIVPVSTTNQSTFGVEGNQNTTPSVDYLTGYIELGWEGSGVPAPVARAP
jgi:hypothetical protein